MQVLFLQNVAYLNATWVPAGLAAARQLQTNGFQVLVLEGHDRAGGRVYTKRMQVRLVKLIQCS